MGIIRRLKLPSNIVLLNIVCFIDHSEPEKIGTEGVIRLLEDLHLDPGNRLVLLLAWKCEASNQCEFTQEEFVTGMTSLG